MPKIDFEGQWYNQHGSDMELTVKKGKVTGVYRTRVGAPGDAEEFDLVGFCSGDLLTFTVNFGKYGSLTAFAGQNTEDDKGERIDMFWHLVKDVRDGSEPDQMWAALLTGMDVFRRGAPPAQLNLQSVMRRPSSPIRPVEIDADPEEADTDESTH
jgi:hypothetical protein